MPIVPDQLRCISQTTDLLGESPVWDSATARLWWVDIAGQALRCIDPERGEMRWGFDQEPGCLALAPAGQVLLAMRSRLALFDPQTGQCQTLAPVPYDTATTRCNDGRCDALGRFWVGTVFEPKTAPAAALYCLRRNAAGERTLVEAAGGNLTANGLAFSPDNTSVWWSNTPEHVIHRYPFDLAQGTLGEASTFRRFPRKVADVPYGGRPDGAAVDTAGNYWVAMYEGGRVLQLAPDGSELLDIALPVSHPTMVCLGGPDLRTLFVTSASKALTPEQRISQPLAGRVIAIELDDLPVPDSLRGLPATPFNPDA